MYNEPESLLIPTTYSRIIARVLGLYERDLGRLLRGTQLPNSILLPGDDTHINVQQQISIVENAQDIIGDRQFGLKFGSQLLPSTHGALGYLILSSPDLKTALDSFIDYLPFRIPFIRVSISSDSEYMICTLELLIRPSERVTSILHECFSLIIQAVVESVLGRPLLTGLATFTHPTPSYHEHYREYIHSPTLFGQVSTSYQIPLVLANAVNASVDPDSYALAKKQCHKLLRNLPVNRISTADQVRRLILSTPMGTLKEDDVAKALFTSKRTLSRRLAREGSSYRAITEKVLSELAIRHLAEKGLSIDKIALMLGYSDAAAFRKAFHRWYEKSPSEYRLCQSE
ncbi:AraC family transcriptional regulator [Zhongshania borealis]|uniref:AraC family transcriptional regulator n=1 Tax=Zhongshania borealis TaxID=889488 RepID=A0ABP7WS18_9GAMM